jgi:hypothetical protein
MTKASSVTIGERFKISTNVSIGCVSTVFSELKPVLSDPQVKIFVVSFVSYMVFMARQLVCIHTLYCDLVL